jgi:hypothetical protein
MVLADQVDGDLAAVAPLDERHGEGGDPGAAQAAAEQHGQDGAVAQTLAAMSGLAQMMPSLTRVRASGDQASGTLTMAGEQRTSARRPLPHWDLTAGRLAQAAP